MLYYSLSQSYYSLSVGKFPLYTFTSPFEEIYIYYHLLNIGRMLLPLFILNRDLAKAFSQTKGLRELDTV